MGGKGKRSATSSVSAKDRAYFHFLDEIKSRILSARIRASRALNKELVRLYWDIGRSIVERQKEHGWGRSVVEKLAGDLKREFPDAGGYSPQNLWYMRQFYLEYAGTPILQQLVGEIPWGHNLLIIQKVKNDEERQYYLEASARLGWAREVLLNQIKADAFGQTKKIPKQHNFPKALPAHLAEQADESLKSVYNLDFLGVTRPVLERELEKRLVERVRQFILELGVGFCFIGSQYRLAAGEEEFFIDLLFFNRKLRCLVAVELKTGKFKPEYAGKMDFYLSVLNDKVRMPEENPPIGMVLCADKDQVVVEYALSNVRNPVGVAQYQLTRKIPARIRDVFPAQDELARRIVGEMR